MPCVFCRILKGEIPSEILYQDDRVFAVRDIHPVAPTHLLILPKAHLPSTVDMTEEQEPLMGHLLKVAADLAQKEGVAKQGYRLVINNGPQAGQEVEHLHLHLLGGRPLGKMG